MEGWNMLWKCLVCLWGGGWGLIWPLPMLNPSLCLWCRQIQLVWLILRIIFQTRTVFSIALLQHIWQETSVLLYDTTSHLLCIDHLLSHKCSPRFSGLLPLTERNFWEPCFLRLIPGDVHAEPLAASACLRVCVEAELIALLPASWSPSHGVINTHGCDKAYLSGPRHRNRNANH